MLLHVLSFLLFQAYDQHLNMILGDVEEIITSVEIDDETYEEIVQVSHSCLYLFLRFEHWYINGQGCPSMLLWFWYGMFRWKVNNFYLFDSDQA